MSDVSIKYKGVERATLNATGTATVKTSGKYCEADIVVDYVKPQGGGANMATGTFVLTQAQPSREQGCLITHNLGRQINGVMWFPERSEVLEAGDDAYGNRPAITEAISTTSYFWVGAFYSSSSSLRSALNTYGVYILNSLIVDNNSLYLFGDGGSRADFSVPANTTIRWFVW